MEIGILDKVESLAFLTQCVEVCHEERRISILVVARHECGILNVLLLGNSNRCRQNEKVRRARDDVKTGRRENIVTCLCLCFVTLWAVGNFVEKAFTVLRSVYVENNFSS